MSMPKIPAVQQQATAPNQEDPEVAAECKLQSKQEKHKFKICVVELQL